jgi:hypothetical protein
MKDNFKCRNCEDTKWVCEDHADKVAHECCGGAGSPCVDCNPLHPEFKQKRIYQVKS